MTSVHHYSNSESKLPILPDPHLGVQYNSYKLISSSSVTFPHRDESDQRLNWRTYRYRHLELLLSIHYKADADFNGPVSSPLTVFQQKTSICVVRLLSESFYSMLSVVRVQSAPRWGEKFDVNVSDVSPLHLTQAALRSFSPPLQRAAVGLLIKWLFELKRFSSSLVYFPTVRNDLACVYLYCGGVHWHFIAQRTSTLLARSLSLPMMESSSSV